MHERKRAIHILMAEDDPDDRLLTREAFEAGKIANHLHFVEDGEELMDYLCQRGRYSDPDSAPRPDLLLLDLNMPRKSGREALEEIKANPALWMMPVVVLTTSKAEEDILRSYNLSAKSFIVKPVTFEGLVDIVRTLDKYWFEIVTLPPQ